MNAGLRIAGAVDDTADPRMHDGPGTHRAGFQRDEQLAPGRR
jgi:hypothetical protein